ncbi:hypothetical protein EV360DRAFT_76252, partial [Lentinula raphanica]
MARALRQDIPSRRDRAVLSQVAPGMAELNPAPRVGRGDPPPQGPPGLPPAGSFQANRALNGELGVAARQRARLRLSASSAQQDLARVPSPHAGWDPDAFPTDLDLFGTELGGLSSGNMFQDRQDGGELPPPVSSHSARVRQDFGLEGRGASFPRGRGPIAPPASPDSSGRLVPAAVVMGRLVPIDVFLGQLVPVGVFSGTIGAHRCRSGTIGAHRCCSGTIGAHHCCSGAIGPHSGAESDISEWGGIEGELRVVAPPALGPPIELRSDRRGVPLEPVVLPLVRSEVEQFRTASRSQSRQEGVDCEQSPAHGKVPHSRLAANPSPCRVMSLEDGGRPAVRHNDHARRRSRSVEPMDVDPVIAGGSWTCSYAFPDPRTARYLDADPVGMLTSVNPVVIKVLSEGWSEPLPLGHFARRFNPLMSGTAPGDLSTLRMGDNGQVQVHHRRLRDIPLDDLTETDWYQIKRNFPRAVKEFLIPQGHKHTGSEVAFATADMLQRLFTLMEQRDRFSKEITPVFYYVDHKIRWWRAHSLENIRIDTIDEKTFESIYREWRDREDEKKMESDRSQAVDKFPAHKGGFSGHGFSSHSGGGGSWGSSSHHGSRGGRPFADRHFSGGS